MMGVQLDGPVNTFCDNLAVVKNVTDPSSTLKKKHNSISYHNVRKTVAANMQRIAHESGATNIADVLTKPLSNTKFHACIHQILFR